MRQLATLITLIHLGGVSKSRFTAFFVYGIAVVYAILPVSAQVSQDKIRDLGAGALSHEQRYRALSIRTDAVWADVFKTLKSFSDATNPELVLPTLRTELAGLKIQVKEQSSPIMIRKDVDQLRQEITSLKEGLANAARQDLAKKAGTLAETVGGLVEELDAIGQACEQIINDSASWEKEYSLSIQVQGENVARREIKNLAVKAADSLEKVREKYNKARAVTAPSPTNSARPDLRTLPTDQLQELADRESALPVPDKAWLKELVAELKVRLLRTQELEKALKVESSTAARVTCT
jgi:hypothetical protein